MHRVYCKSVSKTENQFSLDSKQSHHLIKALRLKQKSSIEVFDGDGYSAICEITFLNNKKCDLKRISKIKKDKKPERTLSVVVPFIKVNNFNYMIQKLSEIGVNKFIIYKPDLCDQSLLKKDLSKIVKKSTEIIISVCKQCGNNFIPLIFQTKNMKNALSLLNDDEEKFAFDTDAEKYFGYDELDNKSSTIIITGPESGFSDEELKLINNNKIKIRYLGQNILRAETAPIFVSSIIRNQFGRI